MNADGTDRRLLAREAGNPAWSPDGRSLVYNRYPGLQIYRLDLESGVERQLTPGGAIYRFPAWSPDGRRIAFDSDRGPFPARLKIYLMDADGTNADGAGVRRVTPEDSAVGEELRASWSPDGDRLVYAAYRRRAGETDLVVIDTTGANLRVLTPGGEPRWSPRGDWIAFTAGTPTSAVARLHVVRPDGTAERTVVASAVLARSRPAWSPDGETLVFTRVERQFGGLWSVGLDGTGLRQLTRAGTP